MKKEIRQVTENTVQITTMDERWYERDGVAVPSVTWITHFYPKGIAYMQWLAKHGWDEAEAIKTEAGDKGTIVHHAIAKLLDDKELKMDATINDREGVAREMTPDEYACVMSFVSWYKENNPKILGTEYVVWGDGYAGTVDLLCEIDGQKWLIDLKTSQSVWASHELQVSAYLHATGLVDAVGAKLAILQVGYKRNKAGFKFTEVDDQYDLFISTKNVWAKETSGEKPHQKDYPLELKI